MVEWTHFFAPASRSEIEQFERNIGISLPPLYKTYLLSINGGQPSSDTGFVIPEIRERVMLGVLYGVSSEQESNLSIEIVYAQQKDEVPTGFFPIGEDPGGNQLIVATAGNDKEGIYYWDRVGFLRKRTGKKIFRVAANIDDFLKSLEPIAPI